MKQAIVLSHGTATIIATPARRQPYGINKDIEIIHGQVGVEILQPSIVEEGALHPAVSAGFYDLPSAIRLRDMLTAAIVIAQNLPKETN